MYTYSPHRRARNREEGTGERKRRNDRRFYLGWSSARAGQGELAVGALVHGRLGGRDTSSSERRQVCTRAAGYVDERVRWGKGAGVHRGSKGVGVAAISQGGCVNSECRFFEDDRLYDIGRFAPNARQLCQFFQVGRYFSVEFLHQHLRDVYKRQF